MRNHHDEIADYLAEGYWTDPDREPLFDNPNGEEISRSPRKWAKSEINVDLSGLSAADQDLARQALQLWQDLIPITFTFDAEDPADIVITEGTNGTFATEELSGTTILSSRIEIGAVPVDDEGGLASQLARLGTMVHEIGHSLGLGHSGPVNGRLRWGESSEHDTTKVSIMSYNDGDAIAVTPQIADILAIQKMYGANGSTRSGDTTYGVGNTTGQMIYGVFPEGEFPAITIYDAGGTNDTMNYSDTSLDQTIDLTPESFSSIYGGFENIAIARGTVIENAVGGRGRDEIIGNSADNQLFGGAGRDTLTGNGGTDGLFGEDGSDILRPGFGVTGGEHYDGGNDIDTFDFGDLHSDYLVNLATGVFDPIITGPLGPVTGRFVSTIVNIEIIKAGAGHDILIGDDQDNTIRGGGGNDLIVGGRGNDFLLGDEGNDTFGPGVNGIDSGDTYNGGEGIDRLDLSSFTQDLRVDLFIQELDYLSSSPLASAASVIGIEIVDGGHGNDVLVGDREENVLRGHDGNDDLSGDDNSDELFGGFGNDILNGGEDADVLEGGPGNDTYVFDPNFGHDTVVGFEAGHGMGDVLRIDAMLLFTFEQIMLTTRQVGNDVVITVDADNTVTLKNLELSALHADDFGFL